MLRTTKSMKEKYEKIQNYIFALIPEKWEEIYLYASVVLDGTNTGSGELFFYYLPKGILKRRLINVYEVPKRFNINEEQYLKIVEELYKSIKSLKQDFIDTEQELWNSVTISIANFRFKVEYSYEELPSNDKETYIRNVIWKYNYLKIGGENKEERKILEEYFLNSKPTKKQVYETGLYIKTDNNRVDFDKEENNAREFVMYQKDDILNLTNNIKNKFKNNSVLKKVEKNEKHEELEENNNKKYSKNQILDN